MVPKGQDSEARVAMSKHQKLATTFCRCESTAQTTNKANEIKTRLRLVQLKLRPNP